jgi:hypothetical protein
MRRSIGAYAVPDANGEFTSTLRTYTNLHSAPGFAVQTVTLNNYGGRTVRIELGSSLALTLSCPSG